MWAAGAIWANTMPMNLARYLPALSDSARAELYGSIASVAAIPRGDPTREGVILGACALDALFVLDAPFVLLFC